MLDKETRVAQLHRENECSADPIAPFCYNFIFPSLAAHIRVQLVPTAPKSTIPPFYTSSNHFWLKTTFGHKKHN